MYQFEIAGDDLKRLNKMLVWTGHPGVKDPGNVRFVSNDKGIFLWIVNKYCEALFKLHSPIGDHGVRKIYWGEWKRGFTKAKADSVLKVKVKKTEIETQLGTEKTKLYAHPCEDSPGFDIIDASEIDSPSIYFNDEAMSISKIGLSAKTAASFLTPIIWKENYLVTTSIFYSKSASLVVPFKGDACFSQGFMRIPVEAGGGVTGFAKHDELWLSAIDFTCKFKNYASKYDEQSVKDILGAGNLIPMGNFPDFDKKTDRNAYIRQINSMKLGVDGPVTVGNITVEPGPNDLTVTVTSNGNSLQLLKADLVLALRNMGSGVSMVKSSNSNRVAGVLTDSHNDKIVVLAGIR